MCDFVRCGAVNVFRHIGHCRANFGAARLPVRTEVACLRAGFTVLATPSTPVLVCLPPAHGLCVWGLLVVSGTGEVRSGLRGLLSETRPRKASGLDQIEVEDGAGQI